MKETYFQMKRLFAKALGMCTREDYEREADAREKAEEIIRYFGHSTLGQNPSSITTGSLGGLYFLINNEFNNIEKDLKSGKDISGRLVTIRDYANDYYSLQYIPQKRLLISFGSEGGTRQVGDVRINKRISERVASEETYVKRHICEHYPDMTMFAVSSSEYEFSRWFPDSKRLLKRDFNSHESIKAPLDIVMKHARQSLDLVELRPELEYHKEEYKDKWMQNLIALSMHTGEIRANTITRITDLTGLYLENASVPFWDRSLEDAKYDCAGNVKQFDFTKVSTLVIPTYDLAQIAVEYGEPDKIGMFQEFAERSGKFKNIGLCWELGMLYSVARRMYRGIAKHDWAKFHDTLDLALNLQFREIDAGNMLIEDLKRYRKKI